MQYRWLVGIFMMTVLTVVIAFALPVHKSSAGSLEHRIGFFDFQHGQSGVAPNAIELHPVLSILLRVSSAVSSSAPAVRPTSVWKPHPVAPPTGSFSVHTSVIPNPVASGDYPTLYGYSSP